MIVVRTSDTVLGKTALVAPSINLEFSAQVEHAVIEGIRGDTEGLVVPGQKTIVSELVFFDAKGGGKGASITLRSGHRFRVNLGTVTEITAGSAINVANAFVELRSEDVGIIGAVGRGSGGKGLVQSLEQRGLTDLLFFRRKEGTARTLFLREPDGRATAFSKKPRYEISPEMLRDLTEHANPRVLICTGFLPYELPIVEALWKAPIQEAKILSPHLACSNDPDALRRCWNLAASADLFQLNAMEFGRFMDWDGENTLPADEQELITAFKRVGSRIVCITNAENGSVVYDRDRNRLIRQSAFPIQTVVNSVGAGDVHLASMVYYLWLRGRRVPLETAIEVSSRICAHKVAFPTETPRPWDGIPDSATRKPWVREAETKQKF